MFSSYREFVKKQHSVLAHIDGPPCSGKSTLADQLRKFDLTVIDLDEVDQQAVSQEEIVDKAYLSDEGFHKLQEIRQRILDHMIKEADHDIVIVGIAEESGERYHFPKDIKRYVLKRDIGKIVLCQQLRKKRRPNSEVMTEEQVRHEIQSLIMKDYLPRTAKEILKEIKSLSQKSLGVHLRPAL